MELLLPLNDETAQLLKASRRRVKASPGQLGLDMNTEGGGGQLALNWDETEHPRAPKGTPHGGEFVKKDQAGAEIGPPPLPPPSPALEAKPESLRPGDENYKYRDTGYIPESRKELAANQIRRMVKAGERISVEDIDWDQLEENPREAASLITKANIFGASTFDEMEERGVAPGAAFLIQKIYASIAPTPGDSPADRRNYVLGIDTLRDQLEDARSVEDVENVLEEVLNNLNGERYTAEDEAKIAQLRAAARAKREEWMAQEEIEKKAYDQWSAINYGEVSKLTYKIEDRKRRGWKPDPKLDAALADARKRLAAADAEWEAARKIADKRQLRAEFHQASDAVANMRQFGKIRNAVENPLYAAYRALGDSFCKVASWKSYKGSEAFRNHIVNAKRGKITDYGFAKGEKKVRAATKRKVMFQLLVADEITRKGGRSMAVDSTMGLKTHFGLRDVQSGEWVLNDVDSARFHVENAAMALQDLADMLGMADHEVGFKGRLALAFGARGKGQRSAAAHYEPIHRVINLTKMRGGGSLAHEWWHAFDNLVTDAMAGVDSGKTRYASENSGQLPSGPVRDAFSRLLEFIDKSQFKAEAKKIDAGSGGNREYWSRSTELTARAFAAFVEDELTERSQRNTYLTDKNSNKYYAHLYNVLDGSAIKPCPEGEERKVLHGLFRELFAAVKADGTMKKALAAAFPLRLLVPVRPAVRLVVAV